MRRTKQLETMAKKDQILELLRAYENETEFDGQAINERKYDALATDLVKLETKDCNLDSAKRNRIMDLEDELKTSNKIMKTEFKRKHKKLTVWGNLVRTVNINLESRVPYEEAQDIEVDLTNEELKELIKTLQSLVL